MIGKKLDVADLWLHPKNLIQRGRNRGEWGGKVRERIKRGKGLKQREEGSEQVREGRSEREEVKENRE